MDAGKVALVIGAASGIGRAIAEALAERGAQVIVADRNLEAAAGVAATLSSRGLLAEAVRLDVTDPDLVERTVASVVQTCGRIDLFVNSAGIAIGGELRHWDRADWERIIGVNLWGTIFTTTAVYQQMLTQGSGQIVNVSSGAGLVPNPMRTAYATTKYAVVGFSTSLRHEAEAHGIKVSVACPGPVRTPIFDTIEILGTTPEQRARVISQVTARNRWTTPERAARVILRGAARDRAIITVTGLMAFLWRFYRHLPRIYERSVARLMVNRDRRSLTPMTTPGPGPTWTAR